MQGKRWTSGHHSKKKKKMTRLLRSTVTVKKGQTLMCAIAFIMMLYKYSQNVNDNARSNKK